VRETVEKRIARQIPAGIKSKDIDAGKSVRHLLAVSAYIQVEVRQIIPGLWVAHSLIAYFLQ